MKEPDKYYVESISVRGEEWKSFDFSTFDVVLHVAAIVHKKESSEMKKLYFKVNRDLPINIAKKAIIDGVSQFIFMSTMAIYGEEGTLQQEMVITNTTAVNPKSLYAISKLEAEMKLVEMNNNSFKVVILRPPMIYGPNCKGNYGRLERLAIKSPIFPLIDNKRSMVHVEKLCQYVKRYIEKEVQGLYFPQDDEYVNTSQMVKKISENNGKSIHLSKIAGISIKLIFKKNKLIKRVFGNLVYEKENNGLSL
jgi:UDP-glucose 4-epimerase